MVQKSGESPVEVGGLSTMIYRGFIHPNGGCWGFLNHQQYYSLKSHVTFFPFSSGRLKEWSIDIAEKFAAAVLQLSGLH